MKKMVCTILVGIVLCSPVSAKDNTNFSTFYDAISNYHEERGSVERTKINGVKPRLIVKMESESYVIDFFPNVRQYDIGYCLKMPERTVTLQNEAFFNFKYRPLKLFIKDEQTYCFVQTFPFLEWSTKTINENFLHFKGFLENAKVQFINKLIQKNELLEN